MGWEWKDEGNGWKTKQRRTRKPRGGQRAAARSRQSSSTRSQLSSYTPPTSSEREREAPGKPKPQRSSTACSTPSCKGLVFNDRIDSEPHCRYCGQAFNSATSPQDSKADRQELLALAARALRLEEIAPAPEQPNPTSPSRLLKAWNAARNAVAQKTNQHAAMVDKVARWSVELEKARQAMLDLAVELYDAEQAERKARACYETASAVMPGEIEEIMDVDNDGEDDPELQAKVMRARAAVTEVTELRVAKRLRISGKGQEIRQSEDPATEAVAEVPLPEEASKPSVTPQLSPAQTEAASRVQLLADCRSRAEEIAKGRAAKTSQDPRRVQPSPSG